ncbi:UNVERIFIED_CONTAM: hypothetical protein FKN15_068844 [Acipenser sinensis]
MGKIYQIYVIGMEGKKMTVDVGESEEALNDMTVLVFKKILLQKLPGSRLSGFVLFLALGNIMSKLKKFASIPGNSNMDTGYRGLINQGATCYLNTVLQTFFMTPEFRDAVHEYSGPEKDKEKNLLFQLKKLFQNLEDGEYEVKTTGVTKSLGMMHRDGSTFHMYLKEFFLLFKNYQSTVINSIKCLRCGTEASDNSSYLDIPLSLNTTDSASIMYSVVSAQLYLPKAIVYSVENGLLDFLKTELLEGDNQSYCDKCEMKTDTETDSVRYELFAICDHSGGYRGGHYTARIKSFENGKCSSTAYLLMYRKSETIKPDDKNSVNGNQRDPRSTETVIGNQRDPRSTETVNGNQRDPRSTETNRNQRDPRSTETVIGKQRDPRSTETNRNQRHPRSTETVNGNQRDPRSTETNRNQRDPRSTETVTGNQRDPRSTETNRNQRDPRSTETVNGNQRDPRSTETNRNQRDPRSTETVIGNQRDPRSTETVTGNQRDPRSTETVIGNQRDPRRTETNRNQRDPRSTETVNGNQRDPRSSETVNGNQRDPRSTETVNGNRRDPSSAETVTGNQRDPRSTETVIGNQRDPRRTETNRNQRDPRRTETVIGNQRDPRSTETVIGNQRDPRSTETNRNQRDPRSTETVIGNQRDPRSTETVNCEPHQLDPSGLCYQERPSRSKPQWQGSDDSYTGHSGAVAASGRGSQSTGQRGAAALHLPAGGRPAASGDERSAARRPTTPALLMNETSKPGTVYKSNKTVC